MTPTKADIEFFTSEEAKRIQELWEPKFGDSVIIGPSKTTGLIIGHSFSALGEKTYVVETQTYQQHFFDSELIFLPRPDQLWEMLEERGYRAPVLPRAATKWNEKDWCVPLPGCSFERWEDDKELNALGPTPAIALGRALIEVMSKEGTGKEEE